MRTLLIYILVIFVAGCTASGHKPHPVRFDKTRDTVDLSDIPLVRERLFSQYQEWKNVKYKHGGLDKNGIDCSGFVYLTFLEEFGIELPGTTELQNRIGVAVPREDLRPGDLIFFKTGVSKRHVGIYMGENRFLHASTRKGVMVSNLGKPYWRSVYWKAKRVSYRPP